jgi:hypothetical protein
MAFYEAAGVPERSPVGPMRSQHRTVLYKRHLRYWPLIPLASDSRHLLKDFTSCCPTSQKTPFGFIRRNCPPGDRRRYTSRTSRFECCLDGRGESGTLEFEPLRQHPEIVKVFHSAVRDTEFDHGFELLRNNALLGIDVQFRCREFKECRIFQFLRCWNNRVSETDVNLKKNPHIAKPRFQPHPNSFAGFIITDSFHTNRVWKKRQAIVFHILRAHVGEDFLEAGIGRPPSEQIEIWGWTIRLLQSRVAVAEHP